MPKNIKRISKPSLAPQDATLKANMYKGGNASNTTPNRGIAGVARKVLPTNVAMFAQDLAGIKTPLDNGGVKPRELDALRGAARNAQKRDGKLRSSIDNSQDYSDSGSNPFNDLTKSITNPVKVMRTTIGGATVRQNGANSTLTDTYDFNGSKNTGFKVDKFNAKNGLYNKLRYAGGSLGSEEGEGAPVKIELGNLKRPTKSENDKGLYMKGTKRVKAANGLQSVAVPEQGSTSNVLSSTTSMASMGNSIGGPWGAAAGAGIGLITGLIQKKSQDKANRMATRRNKYLAANRTVDGVDESLDQKTQRFNRGGTVKGKIIEIEGKKAPEIHTDKHFNVKNLGTVPHSQGGNKVHAQEGDVVFNTQNSLTKYNKIASAIQSGDMSTLKKEQNKLPEDKGMKAQDGKKKVAANTGGEPIDALKDWWNKPKPAKAKQETESQYLARTGKSQGSILGSIFGGTSDFDKIPGQKITRPDGTWMKKDAQGNTYFSNGRMKSADGKMSNIRTPQTPKEDNTPASFKTPFVQTIPKFATNPMNGFKGKLGVVPEKAAVKTSKPKAVSTKPRAKSVTSVPKNTSVDPLTGITSKLDLGTPSNGLPDKVFSKNSDSTPKPITDTLDSTIGAGSKSANAASNLVQFAGVANNIIQGLKPERPIQQDYLKPEQIQYTDRSESLRQQSTNAATIQGANARNLSGGNVGNVRANQVVAQAGNLQRQGSIDEQEMGRRDAIEAQNVGLRNQANQYNLQRKDMYEGQMKQDRLRKQEYVDTAAADIGQYGMAQREESYLRSKDDKATAAQLAGYNSINGRYQHKSRLDGSTYFEPDADSSITRFGQRGKMRRNPGIFAKGTKAVKTSKYKMK